jgi:hypothetical protein
MIPGIGEIADSIPDFPIPLPIKKSSFIASATYAIRTGELTITFRKGRPAQVSYPDIPVSTIIAFVRADSPGRFYNSSIRG